MPNLKDDEIKELEELCKKATPGPLFVMQLGDPTTGVPYSDIEDIKRAALTMFTLALEHGDSVPACFGVLSRANPNDEVTLALTGNGPTSEANARFIAAARTALPLLLSERREREKPCVWTQSASDEYGYKTACGLRHIGAEAWKKIGGTCCPNCGHKVQVKGEE